MITNIKSIELTETTYNQIINLYSIFSKFNKNILTYKKLQKIISELNSNHHILLYIQDNTIVGAITLIFEKKIIHSGKCVGHIEDFAVLDKYRNNGIGSFLLSHAIELSKMNNCYKCILDCDPNLENYYGKKGFQKKGIYMGLYF